LEWVFMIDEYNILIGIQRTLIDASWNSMHFIDNLFTKVTIKLIKLQPICIVGNSKRYSIDDAANSACNEEIRSK
jgi:hypothetical protein